MQSLWGFIFLCAQLHAHIDSGSRIKHHINFSEGKLRAEEPSSPYVVKNEHRTYRNEDTVIINERNDKNKLTEHRPHGNIHIQAKEFLEKYAHHFGNNSNTKRGDLKNQRQLHGQGNTHKPTDKYIITKQFNISSSETSAVEDPKIPFTYYIQRNVTTRIGHHVKVYENNDTNPVDSGVQISKPGHSVNTDNTMINKFTGMLPQKIHQDKPREDKTVTMQTRNGIEETNYGDEIKDNLDKTSNCTDCFNHDIQHHDGKENESIIGNHNLFTNEEILTRKGELVSEIAYYRHPDHKSNHSRSQRRHHGTSNKHHKFSSDYFHEKHAFKPTSARKRRIEQSSGNQNKLSISNRNHHNINFRNNRYRHSEEKIKNSRHHRHNYKHKTRNDNLLLETAIGRTTPRQTGAQVEVLAQIQLKEIARTNVAVVAGKDSLRSVLTCLVSFATALIISFSYFR